MTNEQKLRNEEIMSLWPSNEKIPVGRVIVLADMAKNDERPDGTFSDAECLIWEEFHTLYMVVNAIGK